ncbi:MAG: acyl-CoA dehydrogenase [Gammaproteobacteria bacterium]|nr:acyl-CoA dehydrogenase [Gammaproteobacteria bacterium]
MKNFYWDDPFLLRKQLTEEEQFIFTSTQQFAEKRLVPRITEAFRQEYTDPQIFLEMGDMGLFGVFLPENFGGQNLNATAYGLIARAIEYVDSGYRSMLSVQSSLVMLPIYEFGSTIAKEKYLPKLGKGQLIGCFGLTEPDHGSDPGGMLTRAQPVDGGYVLNGTKSWITNSPIADIMVIWAKTMDSAGNLGPIKGFIVERGKGVATPPIKGKIGLRASVTGQIILDQVFVPDENVFSDIEGLKGPFMCLNSARFGIAWGALGAAEFCWHTARQYALDRKQFGRPLAANQLIQKKLSDMMTEIALGYQGCLRLSQMKDQKLDTIELISLLKRNSAAKALHIARNARDILGANGIQDEYGVARHLVNLEVVNTYEGTEDIHSLILGRAQTGISAFTS